MKQLTMAEYVKRKRDESPPGLPLVCGSNNKKGGNEGGGEFALLNKLRDTVSDLVFVCVLPHGNVLKCIAELLQRCSTQTPVIIDASGIVFIACDQVSGRLVRVSLCPGDLLHFEFLRGGAGAPLRCTLESNSLFAVFHQLKRRDKVLLYGTNDGQFGSLVDYSGHEAHTKHATVCVKSTQYTEYVVPSGYHSEGVAVPSSILQRCLREYKNLSKRIILTGNRHYIHIQTDARFSLHRSDNLFGVVRPAPSLATSGMAPRAHERG